MDISGVTVAGITTICYLLAMIVRNTSLDNKWIPVFCGILGAILGVVAMYVFPQFPADNIINAMAVGIASGLAATGVNQVYKQLKEN